ncbi:alpha/beta hydrolase family protein [Ilumatobacter sp.]|uniref:alpha/beta hydrolase family protein n=2 Tax=Ilumatobacter sp. TaxID=1967498 RepID=UPI002A312BDA|nr:hypothetical protein [Ilumatobacter sp.]
MAASCAGSDGDTAATTPATDAPAATEAPVVTAAPADTAAPVATDAPTDTAAPAATDPPEPDQDPDLDLDLAYGDYEVGVQTITITDTSGGDRDLTVDVWFPLIDSATDGAGPQQYIFAPGVYYESPFAFAVGSESIAPDGPFPLVIYSHGSGGLRYISSNYTEALASNGYIVAAADHTGNTALELITGAEVDGPSNAINRPNDVTRIIDAFLDPESTETVGFVAAVNPGQIAVTGHSVGGFTAYAMASGYSTDAGEFVADERVLALITLAPATDGLTDDQLLSIQIPALVMAGTDDTSTPIDPNVTRPWNQSASSPSYRVDLLAAEHQSFSDVCAYQDFVPTLPDVPQLFIDFIDDYAEEGCEPDDMPIERAQAITNTFAVAFLNEVFKGGEMIQIDEVDEQTDLVFQAE